MLIKSFLHVRASEFELLSGLAQHIHENFAQYLGENYYIRLHDLGHGRAIIDEVVDLKSVPDAWRFVYVDRAKLACIYLRSTKHVITLLLCGEHIWAEYKIVASAASLIMGPVESPLPIVRKCPLNPYELLEAFGTIAGSLQDSQRKNSC